MRVILLRVAIHNNLPSYHTFPSIFRYIVVGQKNIVYVPFTFPPTPWDILPTLLAKDFYTNWSMLWVFNYLSILCGKSFVLINYFIGNFGDIVVLCHWLRVY